MRLKTLLHYWVVRHSKPCDIFTDEINIKMRILWQLVTKHVIPFEVGRGRRIWMIWQVTWIAIVNGLTLLNLLHHLLGELVARSDKGRVVVEDFAFGHAAERGETHELVGN